MNDRNITKECKNACVCVKKSSKYQHRSYQKKLKKNLKRVIIKTDYFLNNSSIVFGYTEQEALANSGKIGLFYLYLLQSTEFTDQQVKDLNQKLTPAIKNITMSGYDVLIRKGKAEGIEEGIEQGEEQKKIQTIKIGYEEGLSVSLLAKINECSEGEVVSILKDLDLIKD